MNHLLIVRLVFSIIWALLFFLLFHYSVFALIGMFARKTFPRTDVLGRYGIIVSARNEESVIGALLDSIRACRYPADKVTVFVIAHNCSDRTAAIARSKGAVVCEYNNPEERTVGYAYRRLFDFIRTGYDLDTYDGFLIMNADNLVTPDYLLRMNDAFQANGRTAVVTSFRNTKNFGDNYMSALYGIFFIACCRLEARGRTLLGCSTRVSGTGYLFPASLVKNGWPYVTLTEDWEFSADRIAQGTRIVYCDEAEFYDEQPTTIPVMLRQRLRWAKGHLIVFFTRFTELVRSIFRRRGLSAVDRFSCYDIAVSILPLGVIGVGLTLAFLTCLMIISPHYAVNSVTRVSLITQLLRFWTVGFVISYALTALNGLLVVLLERRRILSVPLGKLIAAVLLWPFLDTAALFIRKLEWKVIPHGKAPQE